MAVVDPTSAPAIAPGRTIDIAGTPWPVYKLEALALGAIVCLVLAVVTGSLQVAVLAGASLSALRWAVGAVRAART
ncbi:hypothetical protein BJY24_006824 [Nocardia transvalensis]|uniref:Uncharacterized protein n=1 Tax=Nocardia transvalensis TaxID=37333 RepID=A0A7W9UM13_9NOCA|nr:hypothetical protein [Nocardia transvalensis]MBB5917912.1 hypothetical protein [Nocardia transvalensis]